MSSDRIKASFRVSTHIGVTDEEQSRPQVVAVDMELHLDLAKAGMSDDLADTVDYDRLVREVTELVGSSKFRLLEHLVEEVANLIARNSLVDGVTVEAAKEELRLADIDLRGVSVRIERTFT